MVELGETNGCVVSLDDESASPRIFLYGKYRMTVKPMEPASFSLSARTARVLALLLNQAADVADEIAGQPNLTVSPAQPQRVNEGTDL